MGNSPIVNVGIDEDTNQRVLAKREGSVRMKMKKKTEERRRREVKMRREQPDQASQRCTAEYGGIAAQSKP